MFWGLLNMHKKSVGTNVSFCVLLDVKNYSRFPSLSLPFHFTSWERWNLKCGFCEERIDL